MLFIACAPYLIIFIGLGLSYIRLLPAMGGWVLCALGTLVGLGVTLNILLTGQLYLWGVAIASAVPFAIAMPMVINDLRYPLINDVTTNLECPPDFVAALSANPKLDRDMAYPKRFVPIVRKAYPKVQPLILNASSQQVFDGVENLVKMQLNWTITHLDNEEQIIEAEVSTAFFRFVDDVVVKVLEQDGKTRIDMRSKSRDGFVDAGANAKRIQLFLEQLRDHYDSTQSTIMGQRD